MAKDFSAKQIRTSRLIASGGLPGTNIALAIYSASIASNFLGATTKDTGLFSDVGTDVFLFVSGAMDSKVARGDTGNGLQGVSLFGGDVVVSGTLYAEGMVVEVDLSSTGSLLVSGSLIVSQSATVYGGISGSLTRLSDGSSFIEAGTNVTVTTGSTGNITIASTGGGSSVVDVGWTSPHAGQIDTTGSLSISGSNLDVAEYIRHIGDTDTSLRFQTNQFTLTAASNEVVDFNTSSGSFTVNPGHGSAIDFDVRAAQEGKSTLKATSVPAQVLILSGGGATSQNEAAGSDVAFYVSGSQGSRGTAVRGSAVFGGDVTVSGAMTLANGNSTELLRLIKTDAETKEIVFEKDGTDAAQIYLNNAEDFFFVNQTSGRNVYFGVGGSSKILTLYGTSNYVGVNKSTPQGVFDVKGDGSTSQVFILSGSGGATSPKESGYTDVAFFVSGSIGSKNTSVKGASVFGGDVAISGSAFFNNGLTGSLTKLPNGTSFIHAGANVTVTTGALGQVIVAAIPDTRLTSLLGMMGVGTSRTVNEYTITTSDIVPHNISAAAGAVELNLPASAAWSSAQPNIPFIRISALNIDNAATVDPNGTEFINGLGAGNVFTFATAYDSIDLYPVSGGWLIR